MSARSRLAAVLLLLVLLAVGLHHRYGGGRPYANVTTSPLLPESALETVVTFEQPIGNTAVSEDGRIFFTVHPESRPEGPKLWEWRDGRAIPFPDAERQKDLFQTPLGVVVDGRGRLWTIDHGYHGFGTPRLLAFDLASGAVVHEHRFDRDEAPLGSFLQDLRVDAATDTVFVADASFFRKRPAILAYRHRAGRARRLLEADPSVMPQDWLIRTPLRTMTFIDGLVALKVGVDGIALSHDATTLDYAAMTHDTLYRIPVADLLDEKLTSGELAKRVVAVGRKPLSDGITTDIADNVLVTDAEHGAVVRISPAGNMETLVRAPRVRWADAVTYGPGGWLYLTDSAIPDHMLRTKSHIRESAPYHVFRFRPWIEGIPGR